MKKIAVIGGNLLGCATTLDLALVEEHDRRVFANSAETFSITLFERANRLGGNGFKSVRIDDDLCVEVGSYRTLPLPSGTYLTDLVNAANDGLGTLSIGPRRIAVPGANYARRGKSDAAKVVQPWEKGTYRRVVRSFAAWDWEHDAYHMIHEGWFSLDLLCRVLDHAIWRNVALAGVLWSITKLNKTSGTRQRSLMLAQVIVLILVFIFSPRRVVSMWQKNYTFWGTTFSMLWKHGMTPGVARGSTLGFVKHLSDMNTKNVATCAISIGSLMNRTALESYLRGSGEDYVRLFKYNRNYVRQYMSPVVGWHYAGAKLSEINSLASHLTMLDADFSNSDVATRFSTIAPDNATLCTALLDAAKASMTVNTMLETPVTRIVFDEQTKRYKVLYGNGESDLFDGIVLCASPKEGELDIDIPLGTQMSDLLGYDRDTLAAERYAAQEAEYLASQRTVVENDDEVPVAPSACSHFAVVVGKAKPQFFRLTSEKRIPDLVQMTFAPGVSRFERIREVTAESPGVYTVLCGSQFESEGLFAEMFEEGAELKYFEEVPKSMYNHSPVPRNKATDECFPYIVLGNMFIYAAATDKLAKHPEMDAISAVNAASLFSSAVQWTETDENEKDEEEADNRGNLDHEEGHMDNQEEIIDNEEDE